MYLQYENFKHTESRIICYVGPFNDEQEMDSFLQFVTEIRVRDVRLGMLHVGFRRMFEIRGMDIVVVTPKNFAFTYFPKKGAPEKIPVGAMWVAMNEPIAASAQAEESW